MVVPVIGSMAIKGVFKSGSLLSGLGKTSGKLKEVSQRGKSTTTEMKRMTGQTHLLSKAMAAIGVAGFSALLMTTPQLAGSLAKIKHEMQMLAWSVGKHLKPALDAVATILQGIRTGDWTTVKQGVKELADSLLTLADKAITVTVDTIFGEGTAAKAKGDFMRWIASLEAAWAERDLPKLIKVALWEPIAWAGGKLLAFQNMMNAELEGEKGAAKGARMRARLKTLMEFGESIGRWQVGTPPSSGFGGSYQIGGYVPRTGMYKLHAGETVTMQGSTPRSDVGGMANITLDFSGAIINLANGVELNDFANVISNAIAEKQQSLTY